CRGVAVTARSQRFDFVSRLFGPNFGVNEDPVTGSAHTSLAPYCAQRLGKTRLSAEQGGARKGRLECDVRGERVGIAGKAALY
ncbi:PhzF family phenazine biosynthesis protein, partial [Pseudomonas aeruginosa]